MSNLVASYEKTEGPGEETNELTSFFSASEVLLNFPPHADRQEILPGAGFIGHHTLSPVVDLLNRDENASQAVPIMDNVAAYSQSIQQNPMIWNQAPVPQFVIAHGNSQCPTQGMFIYCKHNYA